MGSPVKPLVLTAKEDEEASLVAMKLACGSALQMAVRAAIELGLLDILVKAGPAAQLTSADLLAHLPASHPQSAAAMVDRILCLLAANNVVRSTVDPEAGASDGGCPSRMYGPAPVCKYLAENGDEGSMGSLHLMNHDQVFMGTWYYLKDAVLEGGVPFDKAHGMTAFEYPGTSPRFNKVFNDGMKNHSIILTEKLLEIYRGGFDDVRVLVDVGGGVGVTLSMITSDLPQITKGINFDLPRVISQAPPLPRVEHVGGDMFASIPNGDAIFMKGLSPNKKRKYIWKMLYIYMLGYDVDFGHMDAVSLISAPKYPEKQVGYIVTSCLLNENHDFLRMAINTVRNDIIGRNETFQCLALTMVGNIGGKDFSESLAPDVQRLLISSSCRPLVRKKAALCLLRLYRKNPDVVNVDGWSDRMSQLLEERDFGVLISVMSLFVALVSNNTEAYWNCVPKCVKLLERLSRNQDVPSEYTYYGIPSPWLQVKTMRALQYFPTVEDPNTRRALFEVLQRILMGTDVVKNVNTNNASHAVLFEALALVMHLDAEKEMISQCVTLLGKFIAVREPNIRYLGLENMARIVLVTDVQDTIKTHQAQIITSLKDPDISIRRRALDLLYGMCDVTNAKDIVEELLQFLDTADFTMREELALKSAILAEKFAPDLSWFVDVILQLIDKAGDFVSDEIWYRVIQFVMNNDDLQPYAAEKSRDYLDKPALHETMVKVSAYLLGEYGHLLARRPRCSPKELFTVMNEKIPTVKPNTVAILLSAYAKILMHTQPPDPELQEQILSTFRKYESYIDVEVQQRAVEYLALSKKGVDLVDVLAEMPKFPERQSALLKKAENAEVDTAEQSATRIKTKQMTSNALVVTGQRPTDGVLPSNQPGPIMMPSQKMEATSHDQGVTKENGSMNTVTHEPLPSTDFLGNLLDPLSIEGPPSDFVSDHKEQNMMSAISSTTDLADSLALTTVGDEPNSVEPIINIEEMFHALCFKDGGVLYEDPYIQIGIKAEWQAHHGRLGLFLGNKNTSPLVSVRAVVLPPSHLRIEPSLVPETIPPRAQVQCPLEVSNLRASRDIAVLDFSYKFGTSMVNANLRLPTVLNKFFQPISLSAEDFFSQWKLLAGPPLKLQEVVKGVKPLSLPETLNLFSSLHLAVLSGLDPNPNNLVASTTFFSENTEDMICLIRVETDPSDRSQIRLTLASRDPVLAFELKELIKEHLINIPTPTTTAPVLAPLQPQSPVSTAAYDDPGAALAGLL